MDWQTFINGYLPKTNPTLSYNGVTLPMPEIRQFTGEHFELPGHAIGDNGIGQALDINIFMGTKAEFDKIANPVITPLPVELSRDEKIDRTLAKMEQVYPGIFSR
jgi:hypothetical protein